MSTTTGGLPPRAGTKSKTQKSGNPNPKKKQKKKAGGFKRFMQILLIVILLAIVGVMAYAGYLFYQVQGMFNGVGPKDSGGTVISQPVAPEKSAKVKPITMALLGTDYRQETGTRLTDVVMVATLNPDTKSATIVSLPRDTYLQLEGYIPNKLNSYYPKFYAKDKKDGTDLAMSEMKTLLGKYLGVDVEYTTVLNFQGFRDVVDSVGGIDINVDMKMCYVDKADGTNINLSTGQQHLNGANSLDYVRYRKSNCSPRTQGSDDFSRNQRQNQVLNAVVDKIQSFSGVTKLGSIIESVDKNMETDIEGEQFKNLLTTYWDIPKQNIKYMPVTGDWKSPYVYINETELANAKKALQDELAGTATHTDQFDQPASTSKQSQ
ncbi:LCP family protein required for cell wall assembly [Paenibacillus sp. SORGH_AS306]|uniref:LCP family protein n=1 Tax=unclassified Paenibacillus TaxID=185978 RepID=UPI002788591C|nr:MULTISPECIES: LCP family protein [unclassified Paenibacillus]MDQ1235026.1 LCP family protein required for cell wall assembly [Paenibacillus sp. SORGH_AS_0306]MDR6112074.1 LCP family protein required for cell wall assembly [Paenibacillus sp. SORGH_AS_0338]